MTYGPWPDDIDPDELVTNVWLTKVSQSLAYLEEVAYAEFTSPVSVTATTEATANQLVSSGAIVYEAVPHLIEFGAAQCQGVDGVVTSFVLFDGSTALGRVGNWSGAAGIRPLALIPRRLTPSAGSHTYRLCAHQNVAGTTTVTVGAGGAGTAMPGFIRITRVPV